jgi:MoxR-like ATPase
VAKKKDPQQVVDAWLERDLSEAARNGQLRPAFEVDDLIGQLQELLAAGRLPVLSGESGVGKTAVIHELVRRSHDADDSVLANKRILQLSLKQRASALNRPVDQMRPEMQKLVEALLALEDVVPFFSDMQLAFNYDLEPQFQSLAIRLGGPLLCEGMARTLKAMFEITPELEHYYICLAVEEPSLERTGNILSAWNEELRQNEGQVFTPAALQEALYLTHRFLARDRLPRKAFELLHQAGTLAGDELPVEAAAVFDRFCEYHQVPRFLVDPAEVLELTELEERFSSQVLGQSEAIAAVVQMIGTIKAGLSDMRRPFGAFMFVGPTGVGKTHLAQHLAEALFGSRDRIVRINMADYQASSDLSVLFGDPNNNIRGDLTTRISGHPFAVLLLDEFEKAHEKIHDRLLQLFDEGSFINGLGETISCRSMIIIATSNEGADIYRGRHLGFSPKTELAEKDRQVDRCLERRFRFEFLNRFDRIVHFHPLAPEHIRAIALRELEKLSERAGIKQRDLQLEVDESVLDWLTVNGYHPDFGARFLRRTIERHATTALADYIVRHNPEAGSTLQLAVRRNRIHARVQTPASKQAARQTVALPEGPSQTIRTLDLGGLRNEAERLLATAKPRLDELELRRQQCSQLLDKINAEGFWEQADRNQVLERYRTLEVSLRGEQRLAAPLVRLTEGLAEETLDSERLARQLEQAALALSDWEQRLAEEGGAAVWLVIANADPLRPATAWLEQMVAMELAWCKRLGLDVSLAALAESGGDLGRAILEVEGPGAYSNLAMEVGIHRLRGQRDRKCRIDCLVRETFDAAPDGIRRTRLRRGPLGLEICCTTKLELAKRGLALDLLAAEERTLAALLSDLKKAWSQTTEEPAENARIYGDDGAVRDPRTGASNGRIKDVYKGKLDKFQQAWREHSRQ